MSVIDVAASVNINSETVRLKLRMAALVALGGHEQAALYATAIAHKQMADIQPLLDEVETLRAKVARVQAVVDAGDVRTLDDFRESCLFLDHVTEALDGPQ